MTQETFATASGRLRRTEISRAATGGLGASTVRWARGISAAAGVPIADACSFIEGELSVEELLQRRGATPAPPVRFPAELETALKEYGKARHRVIRPTTLGALSALLSTTPDMSPPMSYPEWLLLVGELEGVHDRILATRSTTSADKVRSKR